MTGCQDRLFGRRITDTLFSLDHLLLSPFFYVCSFYQCSVWCLSFPYVDCFLFYGVNGMCLSHVLVNHILLSSVNKETQKSEDLD